MKNTLLFLTFLLLFSSFGFAQTITMSTGEFTSCQGLFVDSGGEGGPGYSNDEYFVCTICPETEGDVITVDFITFALDQSGAQNSWDNLAIYDGDDTSAGTLGSYTGNQLEGLFVTATPLNTSGCLTFVFDSNGTGTGNFGGTITCDTPCDRPVAVGTYDAPEDHRICVGETINFDGSESYPGDGFTITDWLWDFADGETDASGPITSHSWDEPGEYIVELYLIDDNGCASTNRISLQLLVATYPSWDPFPGDMNLCLGEEFCLEAFPNDYEVTWAGPDVSYENPENVELLDDVGSCFTSEIEVTGFGPGQTLDNINDLISIDISIEHSWLFDLVITVYCPNGNSVILHQQMESTSGVDVGSNGTDLGVPDTEFYDYSWTADAPETWSEVATTGANTALPEDDYLPLEPMEQLVGCELNGTWSFEVCDLWGGDNGELSGWGLNFNPAIVPDVTEFTPEIGVNSDSSFWMYDSTGIDMTLESEDGNSVCGLPFEEGTWEFTYFVENNHGCAHDSTLVITVEQAGQADAGNDVTFCGEQSFLSGGIDGQPTPLCSEDGGNHTFCYSNSTNSALTYCPDNPGDGVTFIDITFNSGSVENFFDEFYVYDGDDTSAPLLAGPLYGDLSGLTFVATNPTGCLTIQVTPDGSVDCNGGSQDEWNFDVGCTEGGAQYVYEWTPQEGLSDYDTPNPEILEINGETTWTLAVHPLGHPDCVSYDEVTVYPAFLFTIDSSDPSCFGNDGLISVFVDESTGEGPWFIDFYEDGGLVSNQNTTGGTTNFSDLFPGNYTVVVGDPFGCEYTNDIVINAPAPVEFEIVPDLTICLQGTTLLEAWSDNDPDNSWTYTWDNQVGVGSQHFVSPVETTTYSVIATDDAGCDSEPLFVTITVNPPITVEISGTPLICAGATAIVDVDDTQGGDGGPYTYTWTFNGSEIGSGDGLQFQPLQSGEYCVYANDGCETPAGVDCMDITIEAPIDVQFSVDTTRGCAPQTLAFDNLVDDALFMQELWEFGDGGFSLLNDPAYSYDTPGLYDVTLTITSNLGCAYDVTYPNYISIWERPVAGFHADPQPTTMPDTEISFFDFSFDNIVEYYWVFDTLNVQGISTDPNPVFQFPMSQGGQYPVSLTVTDNNGCTNIVTRYIEINDVTNFFVPNAFTPDNDGVNDVFIMKGTDIDTSRFEFNIYDRWGDKVFETNSIDDVWDGGNKRSDYYTQNDTYVWQAVLYSLSTAERRELTGMITIIR